MSLDDALKQAQVLNVDLIEIVANANPPVCQLIEFGKFKYRIEQKEKEAKKKSKKIELKELRFHVNIDMHDLETKCRHAQQFLEDGDMVKVSVIFKGREITHKDVGLNKMNLIVEKLLPYGQMDSQPQFEGKQYTVLFRAK
jgi:translation initiation factor IF-3